MALEFAVGFTSFGEEGWHFPADNVALPLAVFFGSQASS